MALGLVLAAFGCSGRVESDCSNSEEQLPVADPPCVDADQDGHFAAPLPESGCSTDLFHRELPDCNDSDSLVHPYGVERLGDGEDWDCDGLDDPEALCLDAGSDWEGEVPSDCPNGNLVIQTQPTCLVCSGIETYVLVRIADARSEYYEQGTALVLVLDSASVVELSVPEVEGHSATYAVPARWQVDAYLRYNACLDNLGLVTQRTNSSSCTL